MSARTLLSLLLVGLLALSGLLATTTTARAQGLGSPSVSGQHLRAEAHDYASEVFGDAWDYDNALDVQLDPGPVINASAAEVAGGRLRLTFEGSGHFHPVWPGFPGGLRLGRDGPVNPVDAARYHQLSMRINSPVNTYASVVWQTCPNITDGCEGTASFELLPGWQTVTVDLRQGSGQPWADAIQGLRIGVGLTGTQSLEVDWMRLHGSADPATVSYTGRLAGDTDLIWDADDDPANNTPDNPGWGVLDTTSGLTGRAEFDVAAHPPGSYRFATRSGGSTSSYSAPLVIEAAPRIQILDPDITGGEDFATAVLGDPWDFSNPEDVAEIGNIAGASFDDGWLHGTNDPASSNPRDPYIVLSGSGDLDASRYHRFTVRMTYEGPFDLSWEPGGGTHGRVAWRQDGHHLWQQTAEVVNYTDRDTYTVVLGADPPSTVMEPDLGQPGWGTGATTHELRWDINEDIAAKRWAIDEIRLAADDEALGSFDITWIDTVHQPGTTINLYADTDDVDFNGEPIATGVTTSEGENVFTWDTSGLEPGTYWVHAEATSPGGVSTSRTYATGPVQVRATSTFDGEPAGMRLAGADRIATAIELARAGFPGLAHTAIIARAGDYPDALAAAPLAAAIGAPVLLNGQASLNPAVRAELERLQVERVILLGGEAAQAAAVEQDLRAFVPIVDRAAGVDRFHTAAIVAERAVEEWRIRGHQAGTPLVALGSRFEDALSAASLAGHARRPLLLASHDSVPEWTSRALDRISASGVTVVGGRGIILPSLLDGLRAQVGDVEELAGADHVETAALAAEAAVANGARRDIVVVASGDAFPDALAAGPAAIARGGVLLLTPRDRVAAATHSFLSAGTVTRLHIAGGTAAVSEAVGAELSRLIS